MAKSKNILITGAGGYIGTMLASKLHNSSLDCKIYGIDNFIYGHEQISRSLEKIKSNYVVFNHDVTKPDAFYDELIDMADVIIPLAAIVGMPACKKQPTLAQSVNVDAISYIISKVNKNQLVIFPNTNSGYGTVLDGVCTEDTLLNAISLYGKQKDQAEQIVKQHTNSVVFRLATACGVSYRHRLDLLVNTLVYEAHTTNKIGIFDEGAYRNYIHVEDICSAFIFAIKHSDRMRDNVFNLGNDSINMTKGQLARVIAGVFKRLYNRKIVVTSTDGNDPDKRDYQVSSQKLYNYGWNPKLNLPTTISELMTLYIGWDDMAKEFGEDALALLRAKMINI